MNTEEFIKSNAFRYIIFENIYNDDTGNDLFDVIDNKYLDFYTGEINALDASWNIQTVPKFDQEFIFPSDFQKLKKSFYARLALMNTLYELFKDRAKKAQEGSDKEESKEFWNDCEEDDWPKNSFNSFDKWYGSREWADWSSENANIVWEDFTEENADMIEALADLEDIRETYGQISFHLIDQKIDELSNEIKEIFDEIDEKIKNFFLSEEKKSSLFEEIFNLEGQI